MNHLKMRIIDGLAESSNDKAKNRQPIMPWLLHSSLGYDVPLSFSFIQVRRLAFLYGPGKLIGRHGDFEQDVARMFRLCHHAPDRFGPGGESG